MPQYGDESLKASGDRVDRVDIQPYLENVMQVRIARSIKIEAAVKTAGCTRVALARLFFSIVGKSSSVSYIADHDRNRALRSSPSAEIAINPKLAGSGTTPVTIFAEGVSN